MRRENSVTAVIIISRELEDFGACLHLRTSGICDSCENVSRTIARQVARNIPVASFLRYAICDAKKYEREYFVALKELSFQMSQILLYSIR